MFSISVPTTITLDNPADKPDGKPTPFATLLFRMPADGDVSKCLLEVMTPDGDVHTVLFNTSGGILAQTFVPFELPVDAPIEHEIIPTGEIKQYPRDYNPNPTPPFIAQPADPIGLRPAE